MLQTANCSINKIMNRSRPAICSSLNEFKIYMSTKSKNPSHYETLEVDQQSTHDDIKSAYYKLSKKYHPDVNTSRDAKLKFQNISDAYEVLGNFNKRKQYDRDLTARGSKATVRTTVYQSSPVEVDPLSQFYKSRMSNYDPMKVSNTQAQFDFDTWTKAHYGQSFRRSLNNKQGRIIREKIQQEYAKEEEQSKSTRKLLSTLSVIMFIGVLFQSHFAMKSYDKALLSRKSSEKKEEKKVADNL